MNSQSNVIVPSGTAGNKRSILSWIGSTAGFAAGWFLMRAVPGKTKVQMFGGGLAGLLIGLVPYHVAKRSGQPTLAANALMWTVLAGTIGGLLLAVPTALGFVVLAARRPAENR